MIQALDEAARTFRELKHDHAALFERNFFGGEKKATRKKTGLFLERRLKRRGICPASAPSALESIGTGSIPP